MRRLLYYFFTVLLVFRIFPVSHVYAARTMTITTDKTSLVADEVMTVTASPSGFTPGEQIYIKGVFFFTTANYFGWTKKDDNWIRNSESAQSQRQVTIGDWDGQLQVKSDFNDTGFTGSGPYSFKVGFYYGASNNLVWSNDITIELNGPTPVPPTSVPTNTSAPAPTSAPSTTPRPSATPSVAKTPTPSKSLTPTGTIRTDQNATSSGPPGLVLGAGSPSVTPTPPPPFLNDVNPIVVGSVVSGVGFAILTGFFIWQKKFASRKVSPVAAKIEP